jgi:hypothetical protein
MKSFERTIAISIDKFAAVSVIYWLIQRGNFARLSARANRYTVIGRLSDSAQRKMESSHLVRKDHEPPICFTAQNATHALCGVAHGIEAKELRFPYPICVAQVFESSLSD